MEKKQIMLISAWVAYLLLLEACFLIRENYKPKKKRKSSSWKPKKAHEIAKWTCIISTAVIITYTAKQLFL